MVVKKNDSYLLKLVGFSRAINFSDKIKLQEDKMEIKRMESRISVFLLIM